MTTKEQYQNELKKVVKDVNNLYKFHEIMSNDMEKEIIILLMRIQMESERLKERDR